MPKARGRGVRTIGAVWALLAMAAVALGAACPLAAAERLGTFKSAKHRFHLVKVVDGLEHPWGLAFLPDGRMLVTERPGRLRIVADGWLVPEPVAGVPEVWVDGQGGLLDVALHPGFAENGLIYLSYASPDDDDDAATAVAHGRLVGARLEDVEEIYVAPPRDDGGRHFGSRLLFADGYLFVTAGERGEPDRAQDVGDPAGSVIRLLEDGGVPEDNPFVGTADARPRALLHRPPQSARHGARGGDGANLRRRARAEGRGRAEPDRARGELRLARDHPRQELYGLQDRRRHPQGRDGPAGALLGAIHLAVWG